MLAAPRRARAAWLALGSTAELRVEDGAALEQARAIAIAELEAIDRACSSHRPDSELSRLNEAGGRTVAVGAVLIGALEIALRAAALTEGAVDPTVGRCLLAGSQTAAGEQPLVELSARGGYRLVELDSSRLLVRIPAGIRLDLGATAKAWAADRVVRSIAAQCPGAALFALGGDIATVGRPRLPWPVLVTHDHRAGPSACGQTIWLREGGLATSSLAVRWLPSANGGRLHIVDPRDGRPVRGPWRTASVAAADCVDANIAATAAIVGGARAADWLERLGLPARLVGCDGTIHCFGDWPPQAAPASSPTVRVAA